MPRRQQRLNTKFSVVKVIDLDIINKGIICAVDMLNIKQHRGMFEVHNPKKIPTNSGQINGLKTQNICKSQIGRDQVFGGVNVPCQHATSVANVLWKPLLIR